MKNKYLYYLKTKKAFILLFLVVLILKLPIINLPLHWDTSDSVVPNAIYIMNNDFNPFIPTMGPPDKPSTITEVKYGEHDWGHPPLFELILALTYTLFSYSLFISHLIVIIFAFLAVFYTYLTCKLLFNKRIALYSSLLLLFSPLFFAQSGTLNHSIPLTSLGIISIYYYLKNNYIKFIISSSILVLLKEQGLFIIMGLFLHHIITKKFNLRKTMCFLPPIMIFVSWLLLHKFYTGWLFYPNLFNFDIYHLTTSLFNNLKLIFFDNIGMSFLTISLIILSYLDMKQNQEFKIRGVPLLLTIVTPFILFFSIAHHQLPRYFLPIMPIIFLIYGNIINIIKNKKIQSLFFFLIILFFVTSWFGNNNFIGGSAGHVLEKNLEYVDFVKVKSDALNFIEHDYQNETILTSWPMTFQAQFPHLGYVSSPLNIIEVDKEENNYSIILYSPQSTSNEKMINIIKDENTILIKRFEKKGKVVKVYSKH
jgi:4-amino-4-deoxy-L-arabinose transferase-like glycosyltransferase